MKDMKIRIDEATHKALRSVAKKSFRSVTKQVLTYITDGIALAETKHDNQRNQTRRMAG